MSRPRIWAVAVAVLAGVALWLFWPPAGVAVHKLVAHGVLTVPLLLLGVLAYWLLRRRRYVPLLLVAGVAGVITLLYGISRIEYRYPDSVLRDPETPGRVWRLVTGRDILLREYEPRPALRVGRVRVARAAHPAVDFHVHLNAPGLSAEELVAAMDSLGIWKLVNLDGDPGGLDRVVQSYHVRFPDRFVLFTRPPLAGVGGPDWPARPLAYMELAAWYGAAGMKVQKELGLRLRDVDGRRVPIDDPRLDPIWERAAELGWPVVLHLTDPTPFFEPADRFNERLEELLEHPNWHFYGEEYPPKETLLAERERLFARHPATIFVGAHMGDNPEDLAYVTRLLERYPNYYLDISSRTPELGRQPYTARRFMIEHQDRILFATDGGPGLGFADWSEWPFDRYYRAYFEFLETDNEHFEYALYGTQKQGRWRIHGLALPDSVLRKIYWENAARLLPGAVGRPLAGITAGRAPPGGSAAYRRRGGRPGTGRSP